MVPHVLQGVFEYDYFVENWKYYSKIIFKYVNSIIGSIFNESFVEKKVYESREQCMRPTEKATTATERASQKKKKKKKQTQTL